MSIAGRITVAEIAARLSIGRGTVYRLLEKRIVPALRLGRRWIVTRHAYEEWERRCGQESGFLDATGATA
jgi:excisionase family DNA binding protein